MAASTYQERSLEVRQETRSYIEKLRAERVERAKALHASLKQARSALREDLFQNDNSKALDDVSEPKGAVIDAQAAADVTHMEDAAHAAPSRNVDVLIHAVPEAPSEPAPVVEAPVQSTPEFASAFPAGFDADFDQPVSSPADPASDTSSDQPQSDAPEDSSLEAEKANQAFQGPLRSLGDIPGLGAGMIWRLNQLGIMNVDDLAASDVAALTHRLGAVGRLVNVALWVALAKGEASS
ncbi:MAG: hypothetical protein AAFW47_08245 [Pseudomonadota bacterium]